MNLQVRPGMVSGILRVGGIAALICSEGRYVLATYFQENLKYVGPGQYAEVAFNLYPGQVFKGHVDTIWKANGVGQYLPSDEIPKYEPPPPTIPQGQYAVKIVIDDPDQSKFPIGAQGATAIYVDGDKGSWAALRKIAIRSYAWLAWLYPLVREGVRGGPVFAHDHARDAPQPRRCVGAARPTAEREHPLRAGTEPSLAGRLDGRTPRGGDVSRLRNGCFT